MPFRPFNFHPQIMSSLKILGYETPTAIQQQSIPVILKGQDMMGIAQTGTGKTAAFVLPILQKLLEGPRAQVRALIIAPTRELAQQTHDTIGQLGKNLGLRSAAIYGGVDMSMQRQKLRRGAEIVVACPGRLLDHLDQGTINLSKVELVVLDEADQMFDMGFLPNVRQILRGLPIKRQSLMFSATMPKDVRKLAEEMLRSPVAVQISNSAPVKSVTQIIYPVPAHLKTELLIKILQTREVVSALIFTRTKMTAVRIAQELKDAGYRATSLQGNLTQKRRQLALDGFRSGDINILVATDVASRGIDVVGITHVINFDMPETIEAYIHRIGRTGRASKLGTALSFVTRKDMVKVRLLENVLGTRLKQEMLPGFDYQAGDDLSQRPQRSRSAENYTREAPVNRHKRGKANVGESSGFASHRTSKKSGDYNAFSSDSRRSASKAGERDSSFPAKSRRGKKPGSDESSAFTSEPRRSARKPADRDFSARSEPRRGRKSGSDESSAFTSEPRRSARKPADRDFSARSEPRRGRKPGSDESSAFTSEPRRSARKPTDRDFSARSEPRRGRKPGSDESSAFTSEPRRSARKPTDRDFSAKSGRPAARSNQQDGFSFEKDASPFVGRKRQSQGGDQNKKTAFPATERGTARSDANSHAGFEQRKPGPRAIKHQAYFSDSADHVRKSGNSSAVVEQEKRGNRPVRKSSQTGNFSAKSAKGQRKTGRTNK